MDFHGVDYIGTCSVDRPRDRCLTYARNEKYLRKLYPTNMRVMVLVPLWPIPPHFYEPSYIRNEIGPNISVLPLEFFDYEFILFHNAVNRDWNPTPVLIGNNYQWDGSAKIGEGIHVAVGPGGKKVHMKHVGNVVIGDDVYVGPFTLIQRATLDSTIIGDGCKIDNHCTIGHNSIIGKNVVFATGAVLGGSVKIGDNSWIGLNCTIKNGVSICANVAIGAASNVIHDITEPGIYAGNPAKYLKPLPEDWNF